jgi:outer membrane protein assembly factor BamB
MKTLSAILIAALTIPASLSAREWTSADGSRTFQGELISFANGKVTVRRSDGKSLVFAIALLSEDDQQFVKSGQSKAAEGAGNADSAEWPRWRGTDISDHSPDKGLLKQWPAGGPQQLWVFRDAGLGYSGPAISGGRLFTMGARDATIFLIALDALTGKEIWSKQIGVYYKNNWGNGPRGTPTVDGDRVYALGARGKLVCAKTDDGSIIWEADLVKDLGGKVPGWGYCESPLIDGDQVICTPGGGKGAIAALDKMTGKKIWQSGKVKDGAQYSSVIPIEHGGKRQYVQLFQKTLAGVSATTGDLVWRSDWSGRTAVIPTPIYRDDQVYIASGYGVGCKSVKLGAAGKAEEVYRNEVMVNHHGGVILVGDHLYGHSDKGGWKCQEFATGKEIWSSNKLGKGAIHYADGMFYCLSEKDGTVALVEASPQGWQEKSRFTLDPQTKLRKPAGKIWTHPVVIGGRLYLRDQELIHCYNVRG